MMHFLQKSDTPVSYFYFYDGWLHMTPGGKHYMQCDLVYKQTGIPGQTARLHRIIQRSGPL